MSDWCRVAKIRKQEHVREWLVCMSSETSEWWPQKKICGHSTWLLSLIFSSSTSYLLTSHFQPYFDSLRAQSICWERNVFCQSLSSPLALQFTDSVGAWIKSSLYLFQRYTSSATLIRQHWFQSFRTLVPETFWECSDAFVFSNACCWEFLRWAQFFSWAHFS